MAKKKVVSRRRFVDPNLVGTTRPAGTRREYQGTVEAQWTCNSCGIEKIPGGTKKCPNCAHPKDASETYEPPPLDAPFLTSKQLADMGINVTTHDSDEECPFCSSRVKPGTQVCPNCNGNIIDVARTTHRCPNCGRESNSTNCPSCNAVTESKSQKPSLNYLSDLFSSSTASEARSTINWPIIGGILLGVMLIGGLIFALWPREEKAIVTHASWNSTIYLEEYQYNQHSNWSVPPGGEIVSVEEQKFHHYESVFDHREEQCHLERQQVDTDTREYTDRDCQDVYSHTEETCYDDGTCDRDPVYNEVCTDVTYTEQVPVYDDVEVCSMVDIYRDEPRYAPWYTYNIWEWVSITPAQLAGTGEPYWPTEYRLDETHRESGRNQTYTVIFTADDNDHPYSPQTYEEYQRYPIGTEWMIKRSGPIVVEVNPLD